METPTRLAPGAASYMTAVNAGCSDGATKVGGAAGILNSTGGSTSP